MRIIAGERRGMRLEPPKKNEKTRPTGDKTKESVFNILQPIRQDARVLDLFAGTGQIGLEFLSRGAGFAVFCEKSRTMGRILRQNVEKTGYADRSMVRIADYREVLTASKAPYDYIYLDPPFGFGMEEIAMDLIHKRGLLAPEGLVILETASEHEDIEPEWEGFICTFKRSYKAQCIRLFKEKI